MRIGIVGFGNFSKFLIRHLQNDFEIVVLSRNSDRHSKADLKFEFADAKTVLASPLVIISIPAQYLAEFLQAHSKFFTEPNVVIDVSSVKRQPVHDMLEFLPEHCQIIGTHPIFGPGSASESLVGLEVVVCTARAEPETLATLKKFLNKRQLRVIEMSPEEHDRQIAYVLGLTQYIGRLMNRLKIPKTTLTTPAYEYLLKMSEIQGNDSWDLFTSIIRIPETQKVLQELYEDIEKLETALTKENKASVI